MTDCGRCRDKLTCAKIQAAFSKNRSCTMIKKKQGTKCRDFSSTATRKGIHKRTDSLFCLQSDSSSRLEVKCTFGKMSLVCEEMQTQKQAVNSRAGSGGMMQIVCVDRGWARAARLKSSMKRLQIQLNLHKQACKWLFKVHFFTSAHHTAA